MAQGDGGIRISDAERNEALSALSVHLSTGRLDVVEYEERRGVAAAPRTRVDLETLFQDLPAPHPDLSLATKPPNLAQETGQPVSGSSGTALVETPASIARDVVAVVALFLGLPGAILLTIFLGMWWVFLPV